MIKQLLKKQLMEIFRGYFYDSKKNKARSKTSTALYLVLFALLIVGVLGGMFTLLSTAICGPLTEVGMGWLYFCLMGLIAILLGAFGSVFNTYAGLYLSKDNDLLLSLPIPVRYIMISRLLGVYLMGLLYSGVVMLPAVIVYWVVVPITLSHFIGGLLLVIMVSLIVLILSCVLGWGVAKISLKLKRKSLMTVLLALLFLGAYYFFVVQAQTLLEDLIANVMVYGLAVKGAAYPLYLFGRYGEGDWLAIGVVTLVVLALFALLWYVLSRSFLNMVTSTGKSARRVYREKTVKQKSLSRTLLGKELARFTSSPNYMLNCGLGTLFLLLGGVVLLFKGGEAVEVLEQVFVHHSGYATVLFCSAICLLASMNDMTVPSVSLEGKTLWLAQALPLLPWQVLRAKVSLQLLLTGIPTLFCALCVLFILSGSPLELALLVAVALLFVLFSALFGLFLGLKLPNLTWTNELAPIKQSVNVFFALMGNWVYAIALAGLYLAAGWRIGAAAYLALFALVTAIGCVLLYRWLKTSGSARFAAL